MAAGGDPLAADFFVAGISATASQFTVSGARKDGMSGARLHRIGAIRWMAMRQQMERFKPRIERNRYSQWSGAGQVV